MVFGDFVDDCWDNLDSIVQDILLDMQSKGYVETSDNPQRNYWLAYCEVAGLSYPTDVEGIRQRLTEVGKAVVKSRTLGKTWFEDWYRQYVADTESKAN